MSAANFVMSMKITSSSPSPLPVRLSPLCTTPRHFDAGIPRFGKSSPGWMKVSLRSIVRTSLL